MKAGLLFWIIFFFLYPLVQAQTDFVKALASMMEQPEYSSAQTGIHVADATTGQVLYAHNSNQLMIPASVLKLVTTASALEILGADYRFKTRVGYTGTIDRGVLRGDLVIIGGGDPALGSEYFQKHYFTPHFLENWADSVKAAGIERVEGRLITDISLYDNEQIPSTWIWEDMGNYYGAGANALTVYDNLTRITFQSPLMAGKPATLLSVYPEISGVTWHNEVMSSDVTYDLAYVFGSPVDKFRTIRGTIPKNRRAFTIKASNPFPEILLAEEFLQHLADSGIFVAGTISSEGVEHDAFNQIASLESPPLYEIVRVLNRESVNLFAEHLVKQIAAETTGIGSRTAGLEIIARYWARRGLDVRQLLMEDGSGLSHFNAVTPEFISSVLRYMKNSSESFRVFYDSVPAAGHGTLRSFNGDSFRGKEYRLKSGSMKRIRCYAGYIVTNENRTLVFTVMLNHFSGSAQKFIGDLEKVLAEF